MYKFGFIGLGLIGGSLAKAIRNTYPDCCITVFARNPAKLEQAVDDGVVNILKNNIDDDFSDCDFVFLCVPVLDVLSYLEPLKNVLNDNCILTDVGSVKENIHKGVDSAGLSRIFVGGHPMAGSQKSGYDNSSAEMLQGCVYIFTRDDNTDNDKVSALCTLMESIGCKPYVTTPRKHDEAVAGISHLPHLAAAALVNTVSKKETEERLMKKFASSGFKDTTRIAASSPDVWSQICSANKDNILSILDAYINNLISLKESVKKDDNEAVYRLFKESNDYLDGPDI